MQKVVDYKKLGVIISVSFRVKFQRGVQFCIWATNILKEYIKKGSAMDDDRLKELGGGGYFKELLERIISLKKKMPEFPNVRQMAEQQGIDEARKARERFKWVQSMNNCKHAAEEIVSSELIYN